MDAGELERGNKGSGGVNIKGNLSSMVEENEFAPTWFHVLKTPGTLFASLSLKVKIYYWKGNLPQLL